MALHESPETPGDVNTQVSLRTPLAPLPAKIIIRWLEESKIAA